ncbi:hypothetical protein [Paenibacillus herberti]|uniref:Uncharacterized protein n=1 Tax=Paenibacillus herberti TaxID=1619309 RepID=A0A229NXD8_9BACL|nr:hypothetical protein [Paenibacillus herberti]OXM14289.1 hypothetical protein CGZ75_15145 [Paenibacillus herberti]
MARINNVNCVANGANLDALVQESNDYPIYNGAGVESAYQPYNSYYNSAGLDNALDAADVGALGRSAYRGKKTSTSAVVLVLFILLVIILSVFW